MLPAIAPSPIKPSFLGSRPQLMQQHSAAPRLAPRHTAVKVSAAASGAAGAAPAKQPAKFQWGANMRDLAICVGLGVVMWFIPPPAGVTVKAWQLLSVFCATIVGIITTPLPLGAVAILGLGAAMLTKVLTFADAFSAFSSEIP